MKYLFILFSVALLYSCNSKTKWTLDSKQPIVDHSTNYEVNRQQLNILAAIKKQNEQTKVLIKNKEYNFEKFQELLKKDKIEIIKTIKDKKEIEELNYSYNNVKTIIIATKK